MAAYNAGVKTVFLPMENLRDLEELDPLARENLELIPCKCIGEILEQALLPLCTDACAEKAAEQPLAEKPHFHLPSGKPSSVGQIRCHGEES